MRVTSVLRRVSASTTRALSCSISMAVCLLKNEKFLKLTLCFGEVFYGVEDKLNLGQETFLGNFQLSLRYKSKFILQPIPLTVFRIQFDR